MKRFIREYADYNLWANQRTCEVIQSLTDEQFEKEVESSFPSIKKTALHIWGAQWIWVERLKGTSPTTFPGDNFQGMKEDLVKEIISTSEELKAIAYATKKKDLNGRVEYKNLAGQSFSNEVHQILAHVFNHGTHHRGQLTTMFRQVGVTRLQSNDLIFYYRQLLREDEK